MELLLVLLYPLTAVLWSSPSFVSSALPICHSLDQRKLATVFLEAYHQTPKACTCLPSLRFSL